MRTVVIKQTEWFEVVVEDDSLSDEEAIAQALEEGDGWNETGYLEVEASIEKW